MKNINSIAKEDLGAVHFYPSDVLSDKQHQSRRTYNLQRALILGNIEHMHANIIFMDREGLLQQVRATIWAVSEEYVLLKGGKYIPIRAVIDLEY